MGAIASSPPSHYTRDATQADRFAAVAAGPVCIRSFREKVLSRIEKALSNPSQLEAYQALFGASDLKRPSDFLFAVGLAADALVQFGGRDSLCHSVQGSDALEAFAFAVKETLYQKLKLTLSDFTNQGILDPKSSSYSGVGMRQWAYQECVEIGLFGSPDPDPQYSLQSALSASRADSMCKEVFDIPAKPVIEKMNRRYYEPLLEVSTTHILIVNGSEDPVLPLSLSPENGNATNPNVLTYLVKGGMHISDFRAPQPGDSKSLQEGRAFEIETMKNWVKASRLQVE